MNEKHLRYIQQNRKKIGISVVILFFSIALGILIFHTIEPSFFPKPGNKIVYVAADESGNFTCDGR